MSYSGGTKKMSNTISSLPLHTFELHPHTKFNRVFAAIYSCALIALFYHHMQNLLHCTTTTSIFLHFSLLLADAVFAFMWVATQAFRMRPIKRKTYPENLPNVLDYKDYPGLDVFICTADPYKEPPINVVNTALSVMAYDYPTDKVSVYVSDDGGSVMTLFAFMEAAKFAAHWLPFCREKNIMERSPEAYFGSSEVLNWGPEIDKIKMMYDTMKAKVESAVDRGAVSDEHITGELESQAFSKWTTGFTRQEHPTVIQVLLNSKKDKDIVGHCLPNLVYVSREKNKTAPHHFKSGALNALLRVSATLTNSPVILTQDCDMFSNDPKTPLNALCYLLDPVKEGTDFAYVQFPQRYHGINQNDTYANEIKRLFQINAMGMDGLSGPNYVGTGCFFLRRAFFGSPSAQLSAEIPELDPNHIIDTSIQSKTNLDLAYSVANCKYENGTKWGSQMGFRYGSLVEDYNTGYRLTCEGWKSVFCNPDRAAFLGDIPITLIDGLSQIRRWTVGLSEVAFSKYSPITFGTKTMNLLMGLCYAHYAFWPLLGIPITIYALLPSLTLLNHVYLFPKISSPWSYLHIFLFLGAYGQDCLEFISEGSTFKQWYSDQRMWMIRGVSSHLFGLVDFLLQTIGFSPFGFNLTSKVVDGEQSKRYEQGLFEFGVASPLFVPLTTTALINLIALMVGVSEIYKQGSWDENFLQLCLSGFVVLNSWPIYEAIVWRSDNGKMPQMVTFISIFLTLTFYLASSLIFRD
ncbi:hypothetical protein ACHQM5_011798 [Ranunculus cassubicifolius]